MNFTTPDSEFKEFNPYHSKDSGRFTTKTGAAKPITVSVGKAKARVDRPDEPSGQAKPRAVPETPNKGTSNPDADRPSETGKDSGKGSDTPDTDTETRKGAADTDNRRAEGQARGAKRAALKAKSGGPLWWIKAEAAVKAKKAASKGEKAEPVKKTTVEQRTAMSLETAKAVVDALRKKGVPDSDFRHLIGEVEKMDAHVKAGKLTKAAFDKASLSLLIEALMASGEVSEQDAPAVAAKRLGLPTPKAA
jgi:soluble cytochrome b562